MSLITVLILFPLVVSIVTFLVRKENIRSAIVRVGAVGTAVLTVYTAIQYFNSGLILSIGETEMIDLFIIVVEVGLAAYIITTGIRTKKYLVSLFSLFQTCLILWFEFTQKAGIEVETGIVFDKLSGVMVLVVGVIGSLICLYAVGYMKAYHDHHTEVKERKSFFLAVLFLFLSAMFGLVLCNNLMWIYFCWEITTFCSYLLIGYTQTKEARNNSLLALTINVGGGVAFACAIVMIGMNFRTLELSTLISMKPEALVLIPVFLLCVAALTKSAQLPFSAWLLGAMVAPTPSSALLHSATMVKAGVYLIIRLAPLLGATSVGRIITLVGAITFLACSLMAIAQRDAKKVLAYSTIANLGLIVMCASIGTQESIWAAILLVIFHAVSKSLLFLSVGSIEHQIGNRNIENMNILMNVSRKLSIYLMIGIAGMFLAPFGMLISKWVAMKSFIDSNNIIIVIILAYGSAATLFYWGKWIGTLVSNGSGKNNGHHGVFSLDEELPIFLQAVIVVFSCLAFPLISKFAIVPYLSDVFGGTAMAPIGTGNQIIMVIMMAMLILLPLGYIPLSKKEKSRVTPIYMAGENAGDNENFIAATGVKRKSDLSNWYLEGYFGGKIFTFWSNMITISILCVGVLLLIWRWAL
ncbi:NADH-quinone oxidoreductase subunit 5 family protein [Aminipila terrae]|uniref:NADH-quinone oxidoreductase subunit L n=1 Tax=Aminipila terrae TaxID=2697030 RepID=A0A6P1MB84_9FIRM|nr:proton-conducting transporter membrane subunit [Aminipila terrae]QHI71111.1 NADH-quinone oxidoreductase subunit L [Aminipila terrae]